MLPSNADDQAPGHNRSGDNNSAYDGLNRLTNFERGTLNSTFDTITGTPSTTNTWSLDALGNPTTTGGATQTFNAQDQITSITGKATPVYDNNGNMKTDELGHTYVFDAWNRMVSAYTGTLETYSYDADNRRPGLSICSGAVSDSYYTTGWQDIEDDVVIPGCGGTTTKSTYVWSESYIDDLVARDQSVNGGAATRVFAQQDANHDTTSLVNASGTVLERFVYDPYGARIVLNGSTWAVTSGNSKGSAILRGRESLLILWQSHTIVSRPLLDGSRHRRLAIPAPATGRGNASWIAAKLAGGAGRRLMERPPLAHPAIENVEDRPAGRNAQSSRNRRRMIRRGCNVKDSRPLRTGDPLELATP